MVAQMTETQIRALIPLRNGACAQFTMQSRTGGARLRMFDRLVAKGICTGPPYYLTAAGFKQLGDAVRAMTPQQRACVGIYSTNGAEKILAELRPNAA